MNEFQPSWRREKVLSDLVIFSILSSDMQYFIVMQLKNLEYLLADVTTK